MIYDILPVNNYKGNSSNKVFDFNFYVENENQLSVSLISQNGDIETLKYNIDYSVSEFKNKNGGFVTYPLENSKRQILNEDETLSLSLVLPFSQETQFNNSSSLNLDSLEYSLDYLTRLIQIVSRKTELCIKTIEGSSITPEELIKDIYQKIAEFKEKYLKMQEKSGEFDKNASAAFETIQNQLEEMRKIGFFMKEDKLFYINSSGEEKEFRPEATLSIGTIFPVLCTNDYCPKGALALDGGEYSKEQFKEFYSNFLVNGLIKTCTYEEYSFDLDNFGQCMKFALNEQEEKFKVPFLKDGSYLAQAQSEEELSKCYNESLPNIKGKFNVSSVGEYATVQSEGALLNDTASYPRSSGGSGKSANNLRLDASNYSSTYQDDAKVQGDHARLRYFVQVSNGELNESNMNWALWESSLEGKANIGLENLSDSAKRLISQFSMPSEKYEELTLGKSTTQYTAPANGWYVLTLRMASGQQFQISNTTKQYLGTVLCTTGSNYIYVGYVPASKGDVVSISYGTLGTPTTNNCLKFIYAQGEV